jgi:hypothetical protein
MSPHIGLKFFWYWKTYIHKQENGDRDRLILTLRSLANDPRPNGIAENRDDIMILLQRHNPDN